MLIALMTALYFLVFSGAAHLTPEQELQELSSLITEHVADQQHAEAARKLVTEMEASMSSFQQDILNLRRQAFTVDSDYHATRADYQRIFDLLDETWLRHERTMIDLRFRMKEHMTKAEWTTVFEALQKDG